MWRRLWELAEVDYEQWRALTRTALRLDVRVGGFGGSIFNPHRVTGWRVVIAGLGFYAITGVAFAVLVGFIPDVFFSGVVFLTYVMVMVGTILLLDYQSVITSPDDYSVLGFQPISSRTYFAVRLTNVLVYTTVLTTAFGLPSIVAYGFFVRGFEPLLGCAALLATYGTSAATALAILIVYTAILRIVPAYRLKRALTYLQVVMTFVVYGGFGFLDELMDETALMRMSLDKTSWLFLHPATWFASYLDLAIGRAGIAEIGPALLSVAALVLLAMSVSGRLSLDYAERLGALTATSEPVKATGSTARGLWFTRDEGRAVALLIRAQFKHDQKFRLGVLSILPLTLFYLYMGARRGGLQDPFEGQSGRTDSGVVLYLAVLLFPIILKVSMSRSDAYRASWIFYTCPADIHRLALSMKHFLVVYFVLPYLSLLALVFGYYFRSPMHVAVHLLVLGLMSHLFLQVAMLLDAELPFSQPMRKGERSGLMVVAMMILGILSVSSVTFLTRWIYPSALLTLLIIATLCVLTMALERLVVIRVQQVSRRWEYIG